MYYLCSVIKNIEDMETEDMEVRVTLKLTFGDYCSIIYALEKELNYLASAGATSLCDEVRKVIDKVRESYLKGLYYEN